MATFLLAIAIGAHAGMDHVLSQAGEKPIDVEADALYRELHADLPAAERKYRNKLVRLSGPSERAGKEPSRAANGP
jgi:hypothetical protein